MEAVMRTVERWPKTQKVWRQFATLDAVMERLALDRTVAARMRGGAALAEARNTCLSCLAERECHRRLESGEAIEAILEFCPNAAFFRACREPQA